MIALPLNGNPRQVDAPEDMPLLWAPRDELDLKGTKFGCGVVQSRRYKVRRIETGAIIFANIDTPEDLTPLRPSGNRTD